MTTPIAKRDFGKRSSRPRRLVFSTDWPSRQHKKTLSRQSNEVLETSFEVIRRRGASSAFIRQLNLRFLLFGRPKMIKGCIRARRGPEVQTDNCCNIALLLKKYLT
jgi:hypothetical protein